MAKLHNNNLVLPITILLACFILGGFYYITESNKQASIERQMQMEIDETIRKESNEHIKETVDKENRRQCTVTVTDVLADKGDEYSQEEFQDLYEFCLMSKGVEN